MTRSAAKSTQAYINDVQLFVLQPSQVVGDKAKALAATLRIERLSLAIVNACDDALSASTHVEKSEQTEAAADNRVCDPVELLRMMNNIADGLIAGMRVRDLNALLPASTRMNEYLYNTLTRSGRDKVAQRNAEQEAA